MMDWIPLLRVLASSQVVLFVLALLLSGNPRPVRMLGGLLGLAVLAYLATPMLERLEIQGLSLAGVFAASLTPVLVVLFVQQVFEDGRPLSRIFWLCAAGYAIALSSWLLLGTDQRQLIGLAWSVQLAKLGFGLMAILMIWRGRTDDLVTERLRLRRWFGLGLGAAVAAIVLVELLAAWRVPAGIEAAGMAALFAGTLALNLSFLRMNPSFALHNPTPVPAIATASPLLERLTTAMQQERLYADHELRIAGLAALLQVPEHQLRKGINQQLGYRNFNQFVNGYRLQEAAERLRSEPDRPILSIALDVGFRSVSSFNTAFKATYGVTPSAYRSAADEI